MPTTFVNTIDETEILAKRSQCDYAGNDIQTTYATKSELPTATSDLTNDSGFITSSDVPVKDVQVGGESVVNAQGIAEISIPPTGVLDVEVDGSSVVNAQGVAEIAMPTFTQINADWDASSGVAEILHKPDLSIYAESSDLATVATTGSYDDLLDKPTIPASQINADWNATSGVQEILNKPNLSTVATTGQYADLLDKPEIPASTSELVNDSDFITLSDVPSQVNADWDSNSGASEILNKPDLSIYAESSDLATVATSGSYNDLLDKPSIPSAQVNADWNATSGVSEILNKPNLATVATTGDYSDLQNLPSIPAAQVNSDWSATSGVAQILNKPSIPTATSDLTNDSGYITLSDVPAQVNADWNATSGVSEILNKPTIPSVDQSYNASSTNAQSGVAVAQALATIPASSYTAGNGIDITSDVISAKVDGTTINTNASGELTVIGGGGGGGSQVNSDWDAVSGVAEILNKPTPKTLTAGQGISIADGVSTVTISCNVTATVDQTYSSSSTNAQSGTAVADAIGNLPTNLTSAQMMALKVALGIDETVLWEGTATNSCTISEAFSNFEKIRLTLVEAYYGGTTEVTIGPTNVSSWSAMIPFSGSAGLIFFKLALSGTTLSVSKSKLMGTEYDENNANWAYSINSEYKNALLKVVGVHRIASN